MKEIRIHCEGRSGLDSGMNAFLGALVKQARAHGLRWRLIWGKSTAETRNGFEKDRRAFPAPNSLSFLLVDSEGPAPTVLRSDEFYMAQLMESWFLADRRALATYYGRCFRPGALPGDEQNIEIIPKADVEEGLKRATENCNRKYDKRGAKSTRQANDLLTRINPQRVRGAAVNCERFFDAIERAIVNLAKS